MRDHNVWVCDYPQVYDVWFRPLFACFVIDVNAKEVVHAAVTREPSERWMAQQIRNVTPFGKGPKVIIRDRVPSSARTSTVRRAAHVSAS